MWMVPKTASESHLAALKPQQPRTAAATKPTLSLPPTPAQQPSVSVTAAASAAGAAGGGGEAEERKGGEAAAAAASSHMGCGYLQLPTATKRRHSWICG